MKQPIANNQSPITNNKSPIKKLKVLTVVGTRPEIIRLSRVILKLDATESIEHILVHTGQNYDYELNEVFFEDLGLRKPDFFLNAAGGNATTTAGQILINIDPVLESVNPDAFLVLGDTNSCLCAIAAKKRKIPIFHMEAGNRCFDQRVPEETNRKIVDHISDVNLTYSDIAREYLLREGLPADRIIKTGSPIYEVVNAYSKQIDASEVLSNLKLQKENYFVVSAHREENINSANFLKLVESLNAIAEAYGLPVIVSTHPRTRNKINETGVKFNKLIQLMKPLGFHDYNHLQKNAKAVLSDSGTISEESSIMNFPALNLREAHERPEAMEEASVMMVGLNPERIMQALEIINTQKRDEERTLRPVADYSMPNVSDKIVRIILSYTDYINRTVWQKES
jgi:UDP-N-acetylglucosamine 2-epimerase (non-hydrolysing)